MWWRRRRKRIPLLDPGDVLLDATNLPAFDRDQNEGKIVAPIERGGIVTVTLVIFLAFSVLLYRAFDLQILRGETYTALANANRLETSIIFANRGVIFDRFQRPLAWNSPQTTLVASSSLDTYAKRSYIQTPGFAHLLGFVAYPAKDKNGKWWRNTYEGRAGLEKSFNTLLAGKNGERIVERDAFGALHGKALIHAPHSGKNLTTSIDADVQAALFRAIAESVRKTGYRGGAAAIMDVKTGEILALTSYPEYRNDILSDGTDTERIRSYFRSADSPLLNRVISAVYAPGSIVKPYVAAAALAEGIISPAKHILSTGALIIPNPYNPDRPSRFLDWKAHGYVDMRKAIAVSSNVYFYAVGGGLPAAAGLGVQEGLGIDRLVAYARRFGFGEKTGIKLPGELIGNIPSPAWKKKVFGQEWLLGNTYHSAIGQYGWLVTPIQALRYVAAIANDGKLFTPPALVQGQKPRYRSIGIASEDLQVVREGMRQAVTDGTLKALNFEDMRIAAKTGTAQVGSRNQYKNSWVIGFWPFAKNDREPQPRFAFVVVLEKAPIEATYGAIDASHRFFKWLRVNEPDYAQGRYPHKQAREPGTTADSTPPADD